MQHRNHLRIYSATCLGSLALIYVLFTGTVTGRRLEARVTRYGLEGPWAEVAGCLEGLLHPAVALALAGALVLLGRPDRPRRVRIAAAIPLAPICARALEASLAALDPTGGESARDLGPAYYPSGHAALVMAMALSLVLTVPPRHRLRVALAAGGVSGVYGVIIFTGRSHHPSDVVGGFLVAAALAATAAGRPPTAPATEEPASVGCWAWIVTVGVCLAAAAAMLLESDAAGNTPLSVAHVPAAAIVSVTAVLIPLAMLRARGLDHRSTDAAGA